MKKHNLADVLTLARLLISVITPVLYLLKYISPTTAGVLFLIAILTDGLDGACARKWPDPYKKERWYNKLPICFDNVGDSALFAGLLVFVLIMNPPGMWSFLITISIIAGIPNTIKFPVESTYKNNPTRINKLVGDIINTAAAWTFCLAAVALITFIFISDGQRILAISFCVAFVLFVLIFRVGMKKGGIVWPIEKATNHYDD